MEEYIIEEIMQLAGIFDSTSAFRVHVVLYINGVFSALNELGVGPPGGFMVSKDENPVWSEFTDDPILLGFVKEYMVAKVVKRFNPPANATLMESLKETISENESRILYYLEHLAIAKEKNQNG